MCNVFTFWSNQGKKRDKLAFFQTCGVKLLFFISIVSRIKINLECRMKAQILNLFDIKIKVQLQQETDVWMQEKVQGGRN